MEQLRAQVERVRRLAANWRLGHYEGDLSVAWDEAAIALLAVLENPHVTHYEVGFDHAATVRHTALNPQGQRRCRRCHCPAGTPDCTHCNCCDVPDQPPATA
jgi:hypothetical protein